MPQVYYDMYKKEMEEYEVAMKSYNGNMPDDVATTKAAVEDDLAVAAAVAEDAATAAVTGGLFSTMSSPMLSSSIASPEPQSDPLSINHNYEDCAVQSSSSTATGDRQGDS